MNDAAPLIEDLREQIVGLARELAAPGVEVWDVQLGRGPRGWLVRVILDRPDGGVTVADCAEINTRLRARLELEQLLAGDFDLEVSSPGLDRPLRTRDEFFRFRGQMARMRVSEGLTSETVVARLVGVSDEGVELDMDGGRRTVRWDAVAEARLEPELPGFAKKAPPAKNKKPPRRRRGRGRR